MPEQMHELDRLAGQLFQSVLTPDRLPEVMDSLATWLQPLAVAGSLEVCGMPNWPRIVDLFVHCRALREFADHAASSAHPSHVAAIILTPNARVLDCDYRGESFLKAGNVMRMQGGQLHCTVAGFQPRFNAALKETADTGRTSNFLLHPPEQPAQRFSLTLAGMQARFPAGPDGGAKISDILCLVAPLDGRRIATARQLMDLFGLSAAEARLARAICHGDSVEEYAREQGLRLPTVRTQLSSIFNKTGTTRQATLVRLIAGIPVVRDLV
ncbi:helix-turn-helix transcriptional regulator [Azonexus sp. IMCC34842]|uniref:helix-turn-helix transcriptional regulator n=1 Tax=Azonexus sp. IMCC34842 TaxID=3420950 RepID=UPI003D0DB229